MFVNTDTSYKTTSNTVKKKKKKKKKFNFFLIGLEYRN
jgi:hypothetical protein